MFKDRGRGMARALMMTAVTGIVFVAIGALSSSPSSAGLPLAVRGTHQIPGRAKPPKLVYDHLLCYMSAQAAIKTKQANLFDQFYPKGTGVVDINTAYQPPAFSETACTPTAKILNNGTPNKVTPNGHYVCYPLLGSSPNVNVSRGYENQLEDNTTTFMTPWYLCVPTDKQSSEGNPRKDTHLMDYTYTGVPSAPGGAYFPNPLPYTPNVTLYDQFHPYPNGLTVNLGNPFKLLTPTEKKLYKSKPLKYPKPGKGAQGTHWIVYQLTPQPHAVDTSRNYVNQLETSVVDVNYPTYLYVPTYKCPASGCPPPAERLLQP
jgi:hypothetical protein